MIYAEKGDIVTCENDHPVCVFTETVNWDGEMDLVKHLEYCEGQVMPEIGTPIDQVKCHCGARYIHNSRQGVFHFKDGWRMDYPKEITG